MNNVTSKLKLSKKVVSSDGSIKFAWILEDGRLIESVYFQLDESKSGLCLSSQSGCNIGCKFCATASQSSARNLTEKEIYYQAIYSYEEIKKDYDYGDLEFVTFAGMGEPLMNYANVTKVAKKIKDKLDPNMISISTVGIVPYIYKLSDETALDYYLFISLHATYDAQRRQIIPFSHKFKIHEILKAGRYFAIKKQKKVTISYLLFEGINDTEKDIDRLISMLDSSLFEVQLLLWNDIGKGIFRRLSMESAQNFCFQLNSAGLHSYIMPSKGRDIQGGCGQLVTEE
jgi:23S rRNA (adenine2503-C2)-methyltransferase